MVSKPHAGISPSIKMSLHIDAATDSLASPDRPILLKGLGSVDGGLVVTGGLVEVVSTAVGVNGSLVGTTAAGVVSTVGFHDVVFYERVTGPAIDGQVAVSGGGEVAAVVDGSIY
ncbi:hypothetical protein TWF225_003570 [Orbilia oligospora]|uniref:Uncharacterized protein n=1 Tax=Orbilia oligospora TaxID=2813651 RepID=A0A7C8PA45_ORBOL|nr:hypothetical protein TWF751_009222 [Orbilia oligospora]KAF3195151.1 hypothetical protein TWF225_003570 [Orbilia oligospora]KAF3259505.1 hypothetical protein TWF217_005201 [Orbilia oligospora]KAF3263990.1 hypothetical protein TWF128_001621 [Orbilia oligospora]KAF3287811.1 hypothetical protein TWF132_008331 [Orbilia oligospora]